MRDKVIVILSLVFFSLPIFSSKEKIVFKGFELTSPPEISENYDVSIIISLLKNRGFYKSIDFVEKNGFTLVKVVEYPIISRISILNLTVFCEKKILQEFNISIGKQFNESKFRKGIEKLYNESSNLGFTHFSLKKIKIKKDGALSLYFNEGIVKRVYEKNRKISERTLFYFFNNIIGKPFNDLKAKKALEKLLYTEAFFELKSKVIQKDDFVEIEIDSDKKNIKSVFSKLAYSMYSGVSIINNITFVRKSDSLKFRKIKFDLMNGKGERLSRLSMKDSGFKREKLFSGFSTILNFADMKIPKREDIIFSIIPNYYIRIAGGLGISLFLRSGMTVSLNNNDNLLYTNIGTDISYEYKSPMSDMNVNLKNTFEYSITTNSGKISFLSRIERDEPSYGVYIEGFASKYFGNNDGIVLMNCLNDRFRGIITTEEFVRKEFVYLYLELNGGFVNGFIKPGIFYRFFSPGENKHLYGLNTLINILKIPFSLKLFLVNKKINLIIGLNFSI